MTYLITSAVTVGLFGVSKDYYFRHAQEYLSMPPVYGDIPPRWRLGLPGVRIRIGVRSTVDTGGWLMVEHVTRFVFSSLDMLPSKAAVGAAALQSTAGGGGATF